MKRILLVTVILMGTSIGRSEDNSSITQSPVLQQLQEVIYHWSAASPKEYTGDTELRDIWARRVPFGYDPEGARRFIKAINENHYFKFCLQNHPKIMSPGEFICTNKYRFSWNADVGGGLTCGGLQTVREIFFRLLVCAQ